MARSPHLTVVIPTKDRPARLSQALASVLDQADDAEVVVVDDGSGSANASTIRELCAADARVRLIRNETPHGAPHGRNQGLAVARGRYWATLDDDDLWLPGKWAAQREALAQLGFPDDVVVVMGITDAPDGRPRHDMAPIVRDPERIGGLGKLMRRVPPASFLNTYVAPTALMRAIGGYDDRLVWGEHTDVLIRLAGAGRFAGVDGYGVMVDRAHGEGGGRVGRDWTRKVAGIRLLLDKHADAFAADPALRAQYLDILGVSQLRAGDRWGAVRTFRSIALGGGTGRRRARALTRLVLAALGGPRLWGLATRAAGTPVRTVS